MKSAYSLVSICATATVLAFKKVSILTVYNNWRRKYAKGILFIKDSFAKLHLMFFQDSQQYDMMSVHCAYSQ